MSAKEPSDLEKLRHSTAHLLAAAVIDLFPNAKPTIGPAIDNGFYYDFQFQTPIAEDDLAKIERRMGELLPKWIEFSHKEVSAKQAREHFKNNPFKLALLDEIEKAGEGITLYTCGGFTDLCRGGHTENPAKDIGALKLLSIAGAYWQGSEKNPMLTRIYGTAFGAKQELDNYLTMLEEAKARDHRKLGKELDLFVFSDLVGAGLPLFTPKGTIVREQLQQFSEELQRKNGFQKVFIPVIAKTDLYKKSGHWDKFGDELFLVQSQETSDQFVLKPMNCPHHIQIYASRLRSYRDLPIRYMETTTIYRDEKAGELLGLSRVRSITQDDAHVFCRMDQLEQEFSTIMDMIKAMYGTLGMSFKARLSFRDGSDKYLGDKKNWQMAEVILEKVAKKLDIDYFAAIGEAAFYGPKIDIMVYDSLNREWQCATQQLDFVQPERFGLQYTDSDGSEKTPVMLHKALLGSIERFMSVYIEHTAGAFPTWVAPVQVVVIPIAERHNAYGESVLHQLADANIRTEINDRNESMQNKIRISSSQKVPYLFIVGDKEAERKTVSIRGRENLNLAGVALPDAIAKISAEVNQKSQKSLFA